MNEQPIRIAQIVGKWLGGGVESVVMNYYRNVDKSKVQFDFICDEDSTCIPYEEIEKLGGRVIIIPPYQKPLKYHKKLKKILKENNYKIVHSHINTLSVFPLFAAKRAGVPVRIAHSHSTTNKKEWKRNIMKQILRPLSKIFATNYFSCSEFAGRWQFGNKSYNKGKVFLMNNAIEIDNFMFNENIRNEVRKELNIPEDTFVIGHIGRFVETKNHSFLLDIFKSIEAKKNDTILVLLGQGPLEEKMKTKAKDLKIDNKVKFLGQKSDIEKYYQAFDLFLLPSLYEGLGMTLIEAQISGLNCIVSDKVPKEAEIIKNKVRFLSIENKHKWIEECLKQEKIDRMINPQDVVQYNIKIKAKELEYFYLNNWRD